MRFKCCENLGTAVRSARVSPALIGRADTGRDEADVEISLNPGFALCGLTFTAYIIESENERFFESAPTARSPRAATYDSRLAEKFVDFEEL